MEKALSFSWISIIVFLGCSGTKPAILGVTDGRLSPCPDASHCVSTQNEDDGHRMELYPTPHHKQKLKKNSSI